jgi:hypothetical protein
VILVLDPRTQGAVLNTAADALPGVPHGSPCTWGCRSTPAKPRCANGAGLAAAPGAAGVRRALPTVCHPAGRARAPHRLSSATTRWGSASADGSIRLHWRLVHFALPVIDYVVTHELAHLREMNHSPAFWDVVRSVMPDYEQALGTLREHVLPALD